MIHKGYICHGFGKDGTVRAFPPEANLPQVIGRVAFRSNGSISEAYDQTGDRVAWSFGDLDRNKAFAAIVDALSR